MKNYLLILSLLLGHVAHAQTWKNLTFDANQPGLETNPLKGFATMWQPSNNFPHSIQGKLFGLDELMLGIDNFDWTALDNFLLQEANKGNHCYIQVNIDPAFGNSDMPGFLVNQVEFQYYDDGNVPDLCPDWNDPDLLEAMLNFIEAFGTKYNKDPRIFLVHLGLYGMWGEWHIGSVGDIRPEFEMTEVNKALIANAYIQSFPDQYLLARYPENMPDPQSFGYSDGLFFSQSISADNPFYFHNTLQAHNSDQNWKLYPIGGEIDPDLQPIIWDVFPNQVGQDVYDSFDAIHPTWLFSHHMLTNAQAGSVEWNNAIRAQKAMGYTFYLNKYRLSSSNGKPAIEATIQNTGLTPMYANWEVEFAAFDANNQYQSLGSTSWNLDLIQPEMTDNYRSFISDSSLADGTYTFLLRIVNPLESLSSDAKPVRFANTTQDTDRVGWISLGTATIASGNTGNHPVTVSSISLSQSQAVMQVGDDLQLTATVLPANATNSSITWVSDHPATASVSASGLVSAGPSYGNVLVSAYTQDGGLIAVCSLIVEPVRVTIPARIEAEDFIGMAGVVLEPSSEGGYNLGYIDNRDWMDYGVQVDSAANFSVDFRIASLNGDGEISLLNEMGDTLDIIQLATTGGWQTYATLTSNTFSLASGAYTIRVLANEGGFNLNWIEFKLETPLSIELKNYSNSIKVYPNPTKNSVKIDWEKNSIAIPFDKVKVLNVWGAYVSASISDNKAVDLSNLPAGIYFLEIELKGATITKKIVKN